MPPPEPPNGLSPLWPVAITFAAILLLTLGFTAIEDRRRNPNLSLSADSIDSGRIVLKRNRYGSYVAPGRINGHAVSFLVDTGASTVALPAAIAEDIGLTRGTAMRVQTASGTTQAYATLIDRIELGGLQLDHVAASITPAMPGDQVLLGMSFLRHVRFTQQGDELVIEPPR